MDDAQREPHELLTPAAKGAIRSYLWKIFIPSAIVLSILSAALGFLVNKWAYGDAYVKAYGEASSEIVKVASAVGSVKGEADAAKKQAELLRDQVESVLEATKMAKTKLDDLVTKDYEGLATNLLRDDHFKSSLANVDQEQLKRLEGRLDTLQDTILSIISRLDTLQNVIPSPSVRHQLIPATRPNTSP
jgi:DNA-binding ferritin-like protein (Dps family)